MCKSVTSSCFKIGTFNLGAKVFFEKEFCSKTGYLYKNNVLI